MNPVGKSLWIKKDAAAIQKLACVCDDLAESWNTELETFGPVLSLCWEI